MGSWAPPTDGLPALDAIGTLMVHAADMVGWSDRIGSIEAGRRADLIRVAGDGLADIQSSSAFGS